MTWNPWLAFLRQRRARRGGAGDRGGAGPPQPPRRRRRGRSSWKKASGRGPGRGRIAAGRRAETRRAARELMLSTRRRVLDRLRAESVAAWPPTSISREVSSCASTCAAS